MLYVGLTDERAKHSLEELTPEWKRHRLRSGVLTAQSRDGETETEIDRETERETETEIDGDSERQRETHTDRERHREQNSLWGDSRRLNA